MNRSGPLFNRGDTIGPMGLELHARETATTVASRPEHTARRLCCRRTLPRSSPGRRQTKIEPAASLVGHDHRQPKKKQGRPDGSEKTSDLPGSSPRLTGIVPRNKSLSSFLSASRQKTFRSTTAVLAADRNRTAELAQAETEKQQPHARHGQKLGPDGLQAGAAIDDRLRKANKMPRWQKRA